MTETGGLLDDSVHVAEAASVIIINLQHRDITYRSFSIVAVAVFSHDSIDIVGARRSDHSE